MLTNDRKITIATASSRKSVKWTNNTMLWSELITRLSTPLRSSETIGTYLTLSRTEQDKLKDTGGFTGTLRDGRRKASHVTGRDLITLDLDNIPSGGTDEVLRRIDSLNCGYCVYSTRKHTPEAPRLRIIVPLDQTCSADEYEPITRKLAEYISLDWCDPTTYEASRLMYWPSCCSDGTYVFRYGDKPFLSRIGMLSQYKDWRDVKEWAVAEIERNTHKSLATKQDDPTAKNNEVGAFCRKYNIYAVIEELLPGIYTPSDQNDRYTYVGGSTAGGAVIYDNGTFLYSHHATDPCSGLLVNAFDLYRVHKYGDLDIDANPDTPTHRLESYKAMKKFVLEDETIVSEINSIRYNKAVEAFADIKVHAEPVEDTSDWLKRLKINANSGAIEKNPDNVEVLLMYDPMLKNRIKKDSFADKIYGFAPLPWGSREHESDKFLWSDDDFNGLRMYCNKVLGFWTRDIIEVAFSAHMLRMSYDPVADYLKSVKWDGTHRLDSLIIDYLGAADNEYTRECTRKSFTAAVARVMVPGIKYDIMPVLTGPQGVGKSTLIRKMGKDWYNDGLKTFEGKESSEMIQGSWLVEVSELEAMNKSEITRVRQFLSQQEDVYRAAYARYVSRRARRCVFFGTSNNYDYLKDTTGNRRFWPIDVCVQESKYNVFTELDDMTVDQLWAEAYYYWQSGEALYITGDVERHSVIEHEKHTAVNEKAGLVEEFLSRKIPDDWYTDKENWTMESRKLFWSGAFRDQIPPEKLVERTQVCTAEIWCEGLKGDINKLRTSDSMEIKTIMDQLGGWEKAKSQLYLGAYGRVRGYRKVNHTMGTL